MMQHLSTLVTTEASTLSYKYFLYLYDRVLAYHTDIRNPKPQTLKWIHNLPYKMITAVIL